MIASPRQGNPCHPPSESLVQAKVAGYFSEKHLAFVLNMSVERLKEFAASANFMYVPFDQRRRGKVRRIDRPIEPLLSFQRLIYRRLLRDFQFSSTVHAGVLGRSIFTAVAPHVRRPVVVTADLADFYPSITQSNIFHIWRDTLGYGREAAKLLAQLTSFRGILPQGAPTSLALANIFMVPADLAIALQLSLIGVDVRLSRWVDDIIVSGSLAEPHLVFSIVADAVRPLGLRLHRKKSKRHVMLRCTPQTALGLRLNNGITVPRERRAKLRAAVHNLCFGIGDVESIMGRVQFAKRCHPDTARRLLSSLLTVATRQPRPRRRKTRAPKGAFRRPPRAQPPG
ncbi:MAG TPA: reverse transcriptase family protein [Thermoanaerobaculia bacterium]|nr:reverse transcriptase family protein [Thermoanaerobaculia bacterium]